MTPFSPPILKLFLNNIFILNLVSEAWETPRNGWSAWTRFECTTAHVTFDFRHRRLEREFYYASHKDTKLTEEDGLRKVIASVGTLRSPCCLGRFEGPPK
jgi:hypothetical protein